MKLFSKKPKSILADDITEIEYLYISTDSFRGELDVLVDPFPEQEKIAHEYKLLTLVAKVYAIEEFGTTNNNTAETTALYDSFFKRMTAGSTEVFGISADEFHAQFLERLKYYRESRRDTSRNFLEAIGIAFCHLVDCPSAILSLEAAQGYLKYWDSMFSTLKNMKAEYDVIL